MCSDLARMTQEVRSIINTYVRVSLFHIELSSLFDAISLLLLFFKYLSGVTLLVVRLLLEILSG